MEKQLAEMCELKKAIEDYMAFLADDYEKNQSGLRGSETQTRMAAKFREGVKVTWGEKYARVLIHNNSAHTFIVLADGLEHPRGTMLKPANYSSPSKKYARGNVLTKDYQGAHWNGVRYMR